MRNTPGAIAFPVNGDDIPLALGGSERGRESVGGNVWEQMGHGGEWAWQE